MATKNRNVQATLRALVPKIPAVVVRPMQLSVSLVFLTIGVLFLTDILGFGSDTRESIRHSRTALAESLAVQVSIYYSINDLESVDNAVTNFVLRSNDVRSAVLVGSSGAVLSEHVKEKDALESLFSFGLTQLNFPLTRDDSLWGEVQVVYEPSSQITQQIYGFIITGLLAFVSYAFFLGKVLNQLDPGRVVPARVETAFDLFTSGVLILDEKLRIVLANKTVQKVAGMSNSELTGSPIDDMTWNIPESSEAPWITTMTTSVSVSDVTLGLKNRRGLERKFSVSCSAVMGESRIEGVLVTLDDLTELEYRNQKLSDTLVELRRSKESISIKNKELVRLATTDSLTNIANRRTLMNSIEEEFKRAVENSTIVSCIMSDIDHFKNVNDTHGHAVGDKVIQAVARVLQKHCRDVDVVGRYGGEEFFIILPGMNEKAAARVAEDMRIGIIAESSNKNIGVDWLTSSFGVAQISNKLKCSADLIDAADRALYSAKKSGRNRVVVFNSDNCNEVEKIQDTATEIAIVDRNKEDVQLARVVELETLLSERENYLAEFSNYDGLTGAPMRSLFLQRIDVEISRANRLGSMVGVLSIEIRELDRIVQSFGYGATDELVVNFVERLHGVFRSTDLVSDLTAEHSMSRLTSNEYGVLLTDLVDNTGAVIVVTRLKRSLLKPFQIGGIDVYLGVNIGIAISGEHTNDTPTIIKEAFEARVIASSKTGKVCHAFSYKNPDENPQDRLKLESDLHDALRNGDLETWFQPKYDLRLGMIVGMEALIRWNHKEYGYVSPEVFVAIAEENGLIDELSDLVLSSTLEQIQVWNSMGFEGLCVSINISPIQFRTDQIVDKILQALDRSGVSSNQLEVELTETLVLDSPNEAKAALSKLRSSGIKVSMDDFGTGYTSLGLLASLPLDTIKIDRSFVSNMSTNYRSGAIVQSIIAMSHALDLRVVAEGVETEAELQKLKQYGCDEVQGYLISKPADGDTITQCLLEERDTANHRKTA